MSRDRSEPRATIATPRWTRLEWAILAVVTLVAAFLRLWRLDHAAPPGLEQDEALGAWISWCLLHTGRDMTGQAWPIFYTHGIGDSPPTLSFYLTIPFQWIGGLTVLTTRLPGALAGIACIPVLGWVAQRLVGRPAGIIAATLLAFSPWHIFVSRFGVGASQCPIEALLPVALLLGAGLLLDQGRTGTPRPSLAAGAGVAAGIACYGFQVMRLYFPVLFVLLAWAAWPHLRTRWRQPRTRAAVGAFLLAFLAFFLPLVWVHLTDPDIARRGEMTRLWDPGASWHTIAGLMAGRYIEHFSPVFLFARADPFELFAPQGQGEMHLYMAPLLAAGLILAFTRLRHSTAARLLIALALAYPLGDIVARHSGPHALRSSPGIPSLMLLAAYGAVEGGRLIAARSRTLFGVTAVALALGFAGLNARYLPWYFTTWNRTPVVYHGYHADLVEAFQWMRPRLPRWDAIYVTTVGSNMPFSVALVTLGWEPERWFAEPRDVGTTTDGWEVTTRFGPVRFLYGELWRREIEAKLADGRAERVLFVLRPKELGLGDPVHVVRGPGGKEMLWLCEVEL
jgi:hypothetical protein